ncbi:MAG: hypothetical protein ACP5NX_03590 [Candidatus Bilamarchaeaceae archaeon]
MSGLKHKSNAAANAAERGRPFWNGRFGKLMAEGLVVVGLPLLVAGSVHANAGAPPIVDQKPRYALGCKDSGDGCTEMHRQAYGGSKQETKEEKKEEKKPKKNPGDKNADAKPANNTCDCFPEDDPLMFVDVNMKLRAERYSCACPEEKKEGAAPEDEGKKGEAEGGNGGNKVEDKKPEEGRPMQYPKGPYNHLPPM